MRILGRSQVRDLLRENSVPETASRTTFMRALLSYAPQDREGAAGVFLDALSIDELQYLAAFLGSCVLLASVGSMGTWNAVGHRVEILKRDLKRIKLRRQREDVEHKLVLTTEFAACCGFLPNYR